MGTTRVKAATPITFTSGSRICSVAYAEDEMTSDDSTARAVGLPSRSVAWRSEAMGGPRTAFFTRYRNVSGSRRESLKGSASGATRRPMTPGVTMVCSAPPVPTGVPRRGVAASSTGASGALAAPGSPVTFLR